MERFSAEQFCDLQEMWNKVTDTWSACGSSLLSCLLTQMAVSMAVKFGPNADNEVLVRKNLVYLHYILQVNHSCLSCKADGNYIPQVCWSKFWNLFPLLNYRLSISTVLLPFYEIT